MNNEMTAVYIDYYSFDNNGTKTIAIHYCPDREGLNYAILGNGGVALWRFSDNTLAQIARLCIQKGITINPIIEH